MTQIDKKRQILSQEPSRKDLRKENMSKNNSEPRLDDIKNSLVYWVISPIEVFLQEGFGVYGTQFAPVRIEFAPNI
jgi:hypothetical protein